MSPQQVGHRSDGMYDDSMAGPAKSKGSTPYHCHGTICPTVLPFPIGQTSGMLVSCWSSSKDQANAAGEAVVGMKESFWTATYCRSAELSHWQDLHSRCVTQPVVGWVKGRV